MGLPYSTTLSRRIVRRSFRKVLECGSPMPLSSPVVNRLKFPHVERYRKSSERVRTFHRELNCFAKAP
jgi:hypothetical protein